uniref:Uncharacterized protein n=1 Tax=Anopheles culicifacies TaxID=139723 RepID=A0A182M3X0_9DIPT
MPNISHCFRLHHLGWCAFIIVAAQTICILQLTQGVTGITTVSPVSFQPNNSTNSASTHGLPSTAPTGTLTTGTNHGRDSSTLHPSSTTAPKVQRKRGSITGGKKNVVVQQPTSLDNANNNSREALSHEGSEPVVYVSDTSGYIPLTALQSSHPRLPPPPVYGGDIDAAWRPDPWDRDYNRRYRFNNTRVQHIEAECQDDYMKIRIGFNGSFNGLLYSSGKWTERALQNRQ